MQIKSWAIAAGTCVVNGLAFLGFGRAPLSAAAPSDSLPPTTQASSAQPAPLPYRKTIDVFLNRLGEGKINDSLTIFSELFDGNADEHDKFQRLFSTLYGTMGKYRGNEVIRLTTVSSQLHRVECMAYFDRHYVLMTFGFWHKIGDPQDQWQLVTFDCVGTNDGIFQGRQPVEYHEAIHPPAPAEPIAK
jgi:hypothetical protein